MQPLGEQRSSTLKRRLEASSVIAFASVGMFGVVDWLWGLCPLRSGVRDGLGDADSFVVTRPVLPATLLRALLDARGSLAATGS